MNPGSKSTFLSLFCSFSRQKSTDIIVTPPNQLITPPAKQQTDKTDYSHAYSKLGFNSEPLKRSSSITITPSPPRLLKRSSTMLTPSKTYLSPNLFLTQSQRSRRRNNRRRAPHDAANDLLLLRTHHRSLPFRSQQHLLLPPIQRPPQQMEPHSTRSFTIYYLCL